MLQEEEGRVCCSVTDPLELGVDELESSRSSDVALLGSFSSMDDTLTLDDSGAPVPGIWPRDVMLESPNSGDDVALELAVAPCAITLKPLTSGDAVGSHCATPLPSVWDGNVALVSGLSAHGAVLVP